MTTARVLVTAGPGMRQPVGAGHGLHREEKRGCAGEPLEATQAGSAWTGMDGLQPEEGRGGAL